MLLHAQLTQNRRQALNHTLAQTAKQKNLCVPLVQESKIKGFLWIWYAHIRVEQSHDMIELSVTPTFL